MEHSSTAPRRALRRASALVLAATVSVVGLAGAAAADEVRYPILPNFEDVFFEASCTPEGVVAGDDLTCVIPVEVADTALFGLLVILDDDDIVDEVDVDVFDGDLQDDGSLILTVTVPDDAAVGADWLLLVGGDFDEDACYALGLDDELDILAGPGTITYPDDADFAIDGEPFSYDEAFEICDGDPVALAFGTIVAATDGGTDGGGTVDAGTGTGVTAPTRPARCRAPVLERASSRSWGC
jgi:hypothetical protein